MSLLLLAPTLLAIGCSDFATSPDRTPSGIRVSPDTVLMTAGETVAFEVELLDQDDQPYERIPAWAPPLWTSDDPDLTEIDVSGRATALRAGETRNVVELAGLEAMALIRANPVELRLELPFNYIVQTTQRQSGDVELIPERTGFLRVHLRGDEVNWFTPKVRATFYHGDVMVFSRLMSFDAAGVPKTVDEGNLAVTFDAEVPADVMVPGVSMVIEVDPEGVVPAAPGSVLRVPETGTLALPVREVRPFRWTLVPVNQAANGFQSRFRPESPILARQMSRLAEDIFPFGDFVLNVREPLITDLDLTQDNGWYALIDDLAVLWFADGTGDYYYGGFQRPPGTGIAGLGYVGFPVSIGMDNRDDVIAHELGHNLSLRHAPCGGPSGVDPDYPYADGWIGQYGWDGRNRRVQRPDEKYDLMTYCDPIWISDYNYEKVAAYRDSSEYDAAFVDAAGAGGAGEAQRILLLRGGVRDGGLHLEPALEWEGRPWVPKGGAYRLDGLDEAGGVLFTVPVQPLELDHAEHTSFIVALPAEQAQADRLAALRLRGPEGVVERRAPSRRGAVARAEVMLEPAAAGQGGGAYPMVRFDADVYPLAVVRDRETGLIRAMSRSGRIALPDGDTGRYEVVLSDGIRSRPAQVVRR